MLSLKETSSLQLCPTVVYFNNRNGDAPRTWVTSWKRTALREKPQKQEIRFQHVENRMGTNHAEIFCTTEHCATTKGRHLLMMIQ